MKSLSDQPKNERMREFLMRAGGDCWKNPYLLAMEAFGLRPNFWCSGEYFMRAGWREVLTENFVWVEDDEGNVMLPPINLMLGAWATGINKPVWAGCHGFNPTNGAKGFLDYEYLYHPPNFTDLSGSRWKKFRKNSRKFLNRVQPAPDYIRLGPGMYDEEIKICIEDWLDNNKDDLIHGGDIMVDYLLNGENRFALIDQTAHVVYGINVFDFNYRYINYRFCVADPDPELFVSEYLRLKFYLSMVSWAKVVNDGGVLDRPGLKEFKDSLNPIGVNEIYSWEVRE